MAVRLTSAEAVPARAGNGFAHLQEWRTLASKVLDGIPEGNQYQVTLGTRALQALPRRRGGVSAQLSYFCDRFRAKYPEGEFRYRCYVRYGAIWVVGKSQHRKFEAGEGQAAENGA